MSYKAFISYSHQADAALAPALQKGLSKFTKPWYRLRALRIFRDQTNLALAPGLWAEIEKSLISSEYLLVLASPEAARSKWIDREIGWWLEQRGPANLLIVLTEGTLTWDEQAGEFCREKSTALNPRLADAFQQEPLWLDLRWSKTADNLSLRNGLFKDAVADIAATLQGVPKDTLIGEDLRQHTRTKFISWTAVALLGMLTIAASGFAWLADQRRATAERRLVDLLYTPSGLQALQDGDWSGALLWFVEALKLDDGADDWAPIHRSRIASVLAAHPQLVDVRFHDDRVVDVALGNCGAVLSTGRDGVFQIGNRSSRVVRTFSLSGEGELRKAELANNDTRLLAITMDVEALSEAFAWLWNTETGSRLAWNVGGESFGSDALPVSDAAIRGHLVTVLRSGLEVWSSIDGTALSDDADVISTGHDMGGLVMGDSGRLAASIEAPSTWVGDRDIEIWDVFQGKRVLDGLRGVGVAFEYRDRWAAVGKQDGSVSLWDLGRFQKIEKVLFTWGDGDTDRHVMKLDEPIDHIEFFDREDWHALFAASRKGKLQAWNIVDGSPLSAALSSVRTHPGGINDVALSASKWIAATAGEDNSVRLWQFSPSAGEMSLPILSHGSWYEHEPWGGPDGVLSVDLSADGRYLLSGSSDATARLWLMAPANPREVMERLSDDIWHTRQALIDGGGGSSVSDDAQPLRLEGLTQQKGFRGLAFSRDGRFVAATDREGFVEVWDREMKRRLAEKLGPVETYATAADLIPGTDRIAISDGRVASIWEMGSGERVGVPMVHKGVRRPLVSPDGSSLVTIGERSFRLWNVNTGEPLTGMNQLAHDVIFIHYSDDSRWLLVAGKEGGQLFSARTGRPIGLPVRWSSIADRATLLSGKDKLQILEQSLAGTTRVWDFSPTPRPLPELEALAQTLSNRRIDGSRSIVPLTRSEFEAAWVSLRKENDRGLDPADRDAASPVVSDSGCRGSLMME